MTALRVVVVDDDESVRRLLSVALPLLETEVEVVGEAEDGRKAVEVAKATSPDLIILDHMMPVRTGAQSVPELLKASPRSDILFFTAYIDSPEVGDELRDVSDRYQLEMIPKGGLADLEAAIGRLAEKRTS